MTTSRFPLARAVTIAALLMGSSLATIASADDDTPATPPARDAGKGKGKNADNPPRTPPEGVRGPNRGGGDASKDGARGGGRERGESRGAQVFATVNSLNLTADQKTKVDAIKKEWDDAVAAFEKENGAKLKELEAKRDAEKKDGGKVSPETIEAVKAIQKNRPTADKYVPRVLEVLTPEQKQQYEAKIKEAAQKRRSRDGAGRDGAGTGGAGTGGDGATGGDRKGTPPRRDRSSGGSGTGGSNSGGGSSTGGGAGTGR
jgi:Spy/CpxP family protein refolding chaperone